MISLTNPHPMLLPTHALQELPYGAFCPKPRPPLLPISLQMSATQDRMGKNNNTNNITGRSLQNQDHPSSPSHSKCHLHKIGWERTTILIT